MIKTVEEYHHGKPLNLDQAAHLLSERLMAYKRSDAIIVAIRKSGVPLGYRMAKTLDLQLTVLPCMKMKHPNNTDQAIGSISLDSIVLHSNCDTIPGDYVLHQIKIIQAQLLAQHELYKSHKTPVSLQRQEVIVVDNCLKTGDTMLACLKGIQKQKPTRIIVAVAVATQEAIQKLVNETHEIIFLSKPSSMDYIDDFLEKMPKVNEEDVLHLLSKVKK